MTQKTPPLVTDEMLNDTHSEFVMGNISPLQAMANVRNRYESELSRLREERDALVKKAEGSTLVVLDVQGSKMFTVDVETEEKKWTPLLPGIEKGTVLRNVKFSRTRTS